MGVEYYVSDLSQHVRAGLCMVYGGCAENLLACRVCAEPTPHSRNTLAYQTIKICLVCSRASRHTMVVIPFFMNEDLALIQTKAVENEIKEIQEIQEITTDNPPQSSNLAFTDMSGGTILKQVSRGNTSPIGCRVTL